MRGEGARKLRCSYTWTLVRCAHKTCSSEVAASSTKLRRMFGWCSQSLICWPMPASVHHLHSSRGGCLSYYFWDLIGRDFLKLYDSGVHASGAWPSRLRLAFIFLILDAGQALNVQNTKRAPKLVSSPPQYRHCAYIQGIILDV